MLQVFLTPKRPALAPEEAQLLATAARSGTEVDGQVIPMWSWGTGPRILLVHGWDSRGVHLGRYVPALVERGHAVTLYDAPAHGGTTGHMTSVVHMGRALQAVARSLGEIHAVIGHSAGSAASLWAFAHGLEVACSVHLAGPSTLEHVMKAAARMASLGREQYLAFRAAVAEFMGCPIEDMSVERLAPFLKHPALIVHDPEDPMIPFTESEALHARWPLSTLRAVRGVGHRRILFDPQIVDDCASFVCQPRACIAATGCTAQEESP